MPRFGKDFKLFKKIFPSLELNITDLLEDSKYKIFQFCLFSRKSLLGHFFLIVGKSLTGYEFSKREFSI